MLVLIAGKGKGKGKLNERREFRVQEFLFFFSKMGPREREVMDPS